MDVAAADIMLMLLVADVADMMCEVCSGVPSVMGGGLIEQRTRCQDNVDTPLYEQT